MPLTEMTSQIACYSESDESIWRGRAGSGALPTVYKALRFCCDIDIFFYSASHRPKEMEQQLHRFNTSRKCSALRTSRLRVFLTTRHWEKFFLRGTEEFKDL